MLKKLKNLFKKKVSDNLVLLRVAGISYSKVGNIYVLILEETVPDWTDKTTPPPLARRVPIIINFLEAQVIAVEIEKMKPQIILIYDVIRDLSRAFKLKYDKIEIYGLTDHEVFAKLVCKNMKKTEIEIKPSDSVAVSIRLQIPIYIDDKLLTDINNMLNEKYDVKRMSEMEKLENYSIHDLKNFLQEAVEKEDYENASLIRDEISRKGKVE
jgi:uncharacterized protein